MTGGRTYLRLTYSCRTARPTLRLPGSHGRQQPRASLPSTACPVAPYLVRLAARAEWSATSPAATWMVLVASRAALLCRRRGGFAGGTSSEPAISSLPVARVCQLEGWRQVWPWTAGLWTKGCCASRLEESCTFPWARGARLQGPLGEGRTASGGGLCRAGSGYKEENRAPSKG